MYQYFVLERRAQVGLVKFNRPESLNALNREVIAELDEVLEDLENDEGLLTVVFTGEGKAFIAGADIQEMSGMDEAEAEAFAHFGQAVFLRLEQLEKPTIAAINGYCLGGGNEFALACDIRLASEQAKFGQPEVTLGITPGFGGTQRLAKVVNPAVAKEMIFTGRIYDAAFAFEVGLISRVIPAEALLDEALGLAAKIARNGQMAVRHCKAAINEGLELPVDEGQFIEAKHFSKTFSTLDQKAAMKAFLAKEKYRFQNK